MFVNIIKQLKPQKPRELEDESFSTSDSLTNLPSSMNLSSVSLNSIKSQTAKVSTQVFSKLKSQSDRVSKLLWSDGNNSDTVIATSSSETRNRPPTILEQLNWPVLNTRKNWLARLHSSSGDEEDIVEKFIRVIQSEDYDERPEETFYNHPHRRRNDREEIRRRLAMGTDDDQGLERPHRKPSLHSRLQSGMNLQICFMNETASDCESQCSDTESTQDREVETDRVSTSSGNSKVSKHSIIEQLSHL
ncbi:Schwannomin-interacting protein 1 [Halocaridina rubra]|uniref:Schwannomin-interacting protein 1 n=1 Tax=Halocaridina rubra TaxID=373956 RepID=A0AAN8ZVW8_HALRR